MTDRVAFFLLREQRTSVAIFLIVIASWTLSGCRPATTPVKISQAEAENLLVRSGTMVLPQGFYKSGFVDAELHVDTEGNVKDVEANATHPALTDIAVTALKKYKFRPYMVNGRPVECLISATANFPLHLPVNVSLRPLKYRLSQSYLEEKKVRDVQPIYPAEAKAAHLQGDVILQATVDKQGNVTDLVSADGNPVLVAAAMDAVRQWKYKPFLLNGKPLLVETIITVKFRL